MYEPVGSSPPLQMFASDEEDEPTSHPTGSANGALVTQEGKIKPISPAQSEPIQAITMHNCEFCDSVWPTPLALREHLLIHSQRPTIPLGEDEDYTTSTTSISAQTTQGMPDAAPFRIIDETSTSSEESLSHQAEASSEYKDMTSAVQSPQKKFKCEQCNYSSHRKSNLRQHKETHSTASIPCNECRKTFKSATLLNKHKRTHQPEEEHQCVLCEFVATRADLLSRHITRNHKNKSHTYKCFNCSKSFSEYASYKGHFASGIICQAQPLNPRVESSTLSPPTDSQIRCEKCQYKTTEPHLLAAHIAEIHSGAKEAKCSICHKIFTSFRLLMSHRRSHSNIKPYKCPQCDKSFKRNSSMHQHVRKSHSNITEPAAIQPSTSKTI